MRRCLVASAALWAGARSQLTTVTSTACFCRHRVERRNQSPSDRRCDGDQIDPETDLVCFMVSGHFGVEQFRRHRARAISRQAARLENRADQMAFPIPGTSPRIMIVGGIAAGDNPCRLHENAGKLSIGSFGFF